MAVFEDISFEWGGKPYTIPAKKLLGAIARVEGVVTIAELLTTQMERGTIKMAVLAQAFGELLRYAGAKSEDEAGKLRPIADDEVYLALFSTADNASAAQVALMTLIGLMVPPSVRKAANDNGAAPSNDNEAPAGFPAADATSS